MHNLQVISFEEKSCRKNPETGLFNSVENIGKFLTIQKLECFYYIVELSNFIINKNFWIWGYKELLAPPFENEDIQMY